MNTRIFSRLMLVSIIVLLMFAQNAAAGGSEANVGSPDPPPDVVVIPPTAPSTTPEQKLLNSMATLIALQEAIDSTPPGGRVIQLEPGLYDFSAVVILDPGPDDPPEHYSIGLNGAVHWFNPHELTFLPPFEDTGYGLVILGKENLTIRGAPAVAGEPVTIIRGCTDPRCVDPYSPEAYFNAAISIGGDFERPSRYVTVEDIGFESLTYGLYVDSYVDTVSFCDPRFGVGTEDLLIKNNTLRNVWWNSVERRQVRPVVRQNHFIWERDPLLHGTHLLLGGLPEGGHPVDALVEDNTFEGGWEGISLVNRQEGATVRHNSMSGVLDGVIAYQSGHFYPPVPSERSVIERNTIQEAGEVGIGVFATSGWVIRRNTVLNSFFGIWTEWWAFNYIFHGIIQPTPAENNIFANNKLRDNAVGVFIGAYARNNTFRGNNVKRSEFVDYFINGPEDIGIVRFGPASGNTIIGDTLQGQGASVFDASGCYPGPGGCPQLDDDGDGLTNEDEIDGANNDNDSLMGFPFVDEDPSEEPNYITGMQAVYGPVIPPWASDRPADVLKMKLHRWR
jgi:hypothetical protein